MFEVWQLKDSQREYFQKWNHDKAVKHLSFTISRHISLLNVSNGACLMALCESHGLKLPQPGMNCPLAPPYCVPQQGRKTIPVRLSRVCGGRGSKRIKHNRERRVAGPGQRDVDRAAEEGADIRLDIFIKF